MRIPDKASIIVKEAPYVQLGVEKKGKNWHCGIICNEEQLKLHIFDRDMPHKKTVITVPAKYRHGRVYSFMLSGDLEGLCYGIGSDGHADAFAREYCYAPYVKDNKTAGTKASDNTCSQGNLHSQSNLCNRDNLYGQDERSLTEAVNVCTDGCFGRDRDEIYSVFTGSIAAAQGADRPRLKGRELLIYKLHVRGYTKLADVKNPGTFQALAEKTDYIKKLGMNAVLLMPCYEFHELPPVREDKLNEHRTPYVNKINYWGYTDGYYYAPKTAYCATDDVKAEFMAMVREFHCKGIEVLMEFYFPYDTAPVMADDILRYWHEQYGVDGFRLICGDSVLHTVRTDIRLLECKLMAMNFGGDSFFNGYPERMCDDKDRLLWYDEGFMEAGRHFLRGDEGSLSEFLSKTVRHQYGYNTVNFMADQDCLTFMDTVSYERKHNEHNAEKNKDGRKYNISLNCGVEGRCGKANVQKLREKMVKNMLTMVFMSASVPMIMAGDEFGISHGGNNNPYCQDNDINYIDWSLLKKNSGLYEYVRKLTVFRKEHECIRPESGFSLCDHMVKGMPDLSYHGENAWYPLIEDYTRDIGLLYCGAYTGDRGNVYILYNMHDEPHEFAVVLTAGKKWNLVVATDVSGVVFDETNKKIRLLPKTAAVYVSVSETENNTDRMSATDMKIS